MIKKEVAKWLPSGILLIKQLLVSVKSFFTLPFFKPQYNGVKAFFIKNYHLKPDCLVFDGTTNGYYSKIKKTVNIKRFNEHSIIDLGSGRGSLYYWLNEENVLNFEYIGIDFAICETKIGNNGTLINDDFINLRRYVTERKKIFFLSNSLCYINDEMFSKVLRKIEKGNEIIIIEPYPNIFWDAHFNGVKPIYRRNNEVTRILIQEKFVIKNITEEYIFRIYKKHYFPISYCIHAIR